MGFFDLMAAPFAECLILVGIHTYLGIHVLKRRVIFVDLALAQIAALGGTVGFLLGAEPGDVLLLYTDGVLEAGLEAIEPAWAGGADVGGLSLPSLGTVLLVVATAVAGAALARYQGFATLQRLQATLARGEAPALEMLEGVLLLIGALLLLTPGFFTDLAGFVCLIPPTRRWLALRGLQRMIVPPSAPGSSGPSGPGSASGPRTLEGEFHRDDE